MRRVLLSLAMAALLGGCGDGFRTVGFLERRDTPLGSGRTALVLGLGDLDGDGRTDAVVVNSQNEVNVLISRGDGYFATGVAYPAENTGGASRSLVVGDLNGDGRAEVVVGNTGQSTISVYMNLGDGRLQAVSANPFGVGCQPVAMALADMNRDGSADLVIACANPNEIHVLKGRGQGLFEAPFVLSYEQTAGSGSVPNPRNLAVGELNGDGILDIAVGTDSDLRILNSPNEGPRNYVVSVPLTKTANALALGDVNGDGINDVAMLVGNQEVRVFEYASGGTYNQFVTYQNLGGQGRNTNQGLGIGDFLKTGRNGLVVTLPNPAEVKLVVSRGESNNVVQPVVSSYQFHMGLTVSDNCFSVGDVTGDGLPDVVLRNGGSVSVLVNESLY